MPYKGYTALTIKESLYRALIKKLEEEFPNREARPSLSHWVSELLWRILEPDVYSRLINPAPRPRFEHINMYEDHVKILDRELEKHGRIVSVYFRNGEPYCEYCDTDECVHVDYAWEMPEVAKVLRERGIRKKGRLKGD